MQPNELDIIFDRFGRPLLRLLNTEGRFITFRGYNVGFVINTVLYNYAGRHVGWYEGGIMRDLYGRTVGFGVVPTDSPRPLLPYKQTIPIFRRPSPILPQFPRFRRLPRLKPLKGYAWSTYNPISLFTEQ